MVATVIVPLVVNVPAVIDPPDIDADDIPVRFGGEEFAILYSGDGRDDASVSVSKIKDIIKAPPPVFEKNKIPYAFSCGIADAAEADEKGGLSLESLIKLADDRLYRAKDSGKDVIITQSAS